MRAATREAALLACGLGIGYCLRASLAASEASMATLRVELARASGYVAGYLEAGEADTRRAITPDRRVPRGGRRYHRWW